MTEQVRPMTLDSPIHCGPPLGIREPVLLPCLDHGKSAFSVIDDTSAHTQRSMKAPDLTEPFDLARTCTSAKHELSPRFADQMELTLNISLLVTGHFTFLAASANDVADEDMQCFHSHLMLQCGACGRRSGMRLGAQPPLHPCHPSSTSAAAAVAVASIAVVLTAIVFSLPPYLFCFSIVQRCSACPVDTSHHLSH